MMMITICGTMMAIHLYWMSEIRRVEAGIPPRWFKDQVDQTTIKASENSRRLVVVEERMQMDDERETRESATLSDLQQRVSALERAK